MIINICLLIVVVLTGMILISYNRFIRKNNRVKETESQIDVLLNQRFDLIPNIVECVKGYTKHESDTLENLTKLRSSYDHDGFSIENTEAIDKNFHHVMMLSEAYPDLKANTQFLSLQDNLRRIEDKLMIARMSYNMAVTSYNNLVESVPSNIVAKLFAFEQKELFHLEDAKRANIQVDLSN